VEVLSIADKIPLYVRWTPEHSPYAVEMRLDLVAHVTSELAQAQSLGIEIGGMLIGELPGRASQVLRVDDVAIIGRRFEDGPIYMLDPEEHLHLTDVKEAAQRQNKAPVGFFRSHLRPGPLLPSIADKTLLAEQFPEGNYAFLLIQSEEPRTAAFFLAVDGLLSEQPSVRKFFFSDSEFKRLPEVPVENGAGGQVPAKMPPLRASKASVADPVEVRDRRIAVASFAALVILAGFALFSGAIARSFRADTNKLNLVATSKGDVLQITWDHGAPFILNAQKALLTIDDGGSHRELMLAPDELRLGGVDYEHVSGKVVIALTLDAPNSHIPPQTINWTQQ
jgi:hypothetical protein